MLQPEPQVPVHQGDQPADVLDKVSMVLRHVSIWANRNPDKFKTFKAA
jgi:hypothetical protein